MRKNDARKLNRKSQEALRIRGVQAVQSGESPTKIAEMLGVIPIVFGISGFYNMKIISNQCG